MKLMQLLMKIAMYAIAVVAAGDDTKHCSKMTVRKEMNDLTESEWKVYLDTIEKALKKIDPATNVSLWETGMLKHMEIGHQIHGTPMFGYDHRYFLAWFEKKLQTINPDFAFFYWDTGKEFDQWSSSKIWKYLGEKEGPVTINGFKGFIFPSFKGPLVRDCKVSQNPPPTEYFTELWTKTKDEGYADYCPQLEYAHGVVHKLVGGKKGQLGTLKHSPADPIFYAHHANIDYTLLQAQLLWKQNKLKEKKSYAPLKLEDELPGFSGVQVRDVLDVSDICISYLPSRQNRQDIEISVQPSSSVLPPSMTKPAVTTSYTAPPKNSSHSNTGATASTILQNSTTVLTSTTKVLSTNLQNSTTVPTSTTKVLSTNLQNSTTVPTSTNKVLSTNLQNSTTVLTSATKVLSTILQNSITVPTSTSHSSTSATHTTVLSTNMNNSTTENKTNSRASKLKNFTIDLPPEWVEMSFKNNSAKVEQDAKKIKETVNAKVDKGETIVTQVLQDDTSRAYVGVKPEGEKNLKRLSNARMISVNIGLASMILFLTIL